MTKISDLPKEANDFIYERSEARSMFRAGEEYTLADEEKKYLEDLGVKIKDHSKTKTTYTLFDWTWTITITHK